MKRSDIFPVIGGGGGGKLGKFEENTQYQGKPENLSGQKVLPFWNMCIFCRVFIIVIVCTGFCVWLGKDACKGSREAIMYEYTSVCVSISNLVDLLTSQQHC